jgi:hypothetical protein
MLGFKYTAGVVVAIVASSLVSCGPSENPINTINKPYLSRAFEFNTLGDTEGWEAGNDASMEATGAALAVVVKGGDPAIVSPDNLKIDAGSYGYMIIRMMAKGVVAGDVGQVFWTTSQSPDASEALSQGFPLDSSGTWQTYVLKLSDNKGWKGLVRRVRIDPSFQSPNATFEIDSIRLQSTPTP